MSFINDIRRVYHLLEPHQKRWFYGVLVVMAAAAVLQVASVAAVYPFLSVVADPSVVTTGWLAPVYSALNFPSVERFLAVIALTVFFLLVLANGVLLLEKWLMERFKLGVAHSISVRLVKSYLSRDYAFFLHRNTSDLQRNVLAEAQRIANQLVHAALNLVSKGLVAIGIIVLLLFADPLAVLVVIGVIGGGFALIYQMIRKRMTELGQEYVVHNRKRFHVAQESFGGVKDVKLLGREGALVERFAPASRDWSKGLAKYNVYKEMPKPVIEILAVGGLLIVLAILLVTAQPVATIIPMMGLFVFAGYRLMPVFRELTSAMVAFRFNEEILNLIEQDLEEGKQGALDAERKVEPMGFNEAIRLAKASFHYPKGERPVLQDVTLVVPKNTAVAFVGETGAGKTTLVDVILGLYEPQQGQLLVDDVPVTRENVRSWQRNIGYVPQEIFLTDDTVRRNIAFALRDDEIDDEAVEHAAKIAHIHDFIVNELPDGYDTITGERGVRLSGGQRQRLGIARALYHDPEVLVLDEATSDIDNVTEANITEAIDELSGSKTLILIAHRLSTIRNSDRIYVLDHGRVVGEGTYDELVATNKVFIGLARHTDAIVQS